MTETLWVAVIGGTSLILSAVTASLLGFVFSRLGKIRKDTKETSKQIVNDHGDRNFRDENDGRHAQTLRLFGTVNSKLNRIEDMNGALLTGWFENRVRIEDIEDTLGGRKKHE